MIKNENDLVNNTTLFFDEFSVNDIQKVNDYLYKEILKRVSIIYGATLPGIVSKRLENEFNYIMKNDFLSMYMNAYLITKYAKDNGQPTCSRGTVGSSLVAFLLGITNVNPLPPYYYCENCNHTEFVLDDSVYSGYDLPEKECPICKNKLTNDGHNIPFEFFVKNNGNKVINIKLNIPLSIRDNVLQYIEDVCEADILGFVPLEILTLIQKYTGTSIKDVDITDSKIYELFVDSRAIEIDSDEPATIGIPEFGVKFVRKILKLIKPENFGDLVRISNLAHGVNMWDDNAETLLLNNICDFRDLNASSEDIYSHLISCGIESPIAFSITKDISKGIFETNASKTKELLDSHNIPEWYIKFLSNVSDMLPKAHSVEYVKLALIFAWYKIYYPVEFYVATLNVRCSDKSIKFINKEDNVLQIPTNLKEYGLDESEIALFNECVARGIVFERNTTISNNTEPYYVGGGRIFVNF